MRFRLGTFRAQAGFAVFFVFISLLFCISIPFQIEQPKPLFGRTLMVMTPSAFPIFVLSGLFVAAMANLVRYFRGTLEPGIAPEKRLFPYVTVTSILLFLVFAWVFIILGYLPAAILMMFSLSFFLGNRSVLKLMLLATIVPYLLFLIFTRVLFIGLPEGLVF